MAIWGHAWDPLCCVVVALGAKFGHGEFQNGLTIVTKKQAKNTCLTLVAFFGEGIQQIVRNIPSLSNPSNKAGKTSKKMLSAILRVKLGNL